MTTIRKIAIAIGVLFFIQTGSYMAGNALIISELEAATPKATSLRIGVLLEFINSCANVAMGVLFFPVLRKASERMALGYTASRVVEAIVLLVGALGVLLLVPAAQGVVPVEQAGVLAGTWHDMAFQLGMVALSIGAVLMCILLYRTRLVPRPLALLGFVGYLALFASGWLEIFGQEMGMVLFLPGAVFEFALPIWLIVKGFDMTTLSASTEARHDAQPRATAHGTEVPAIASQ